MPNNDNLRERSIVCTMPRSGTNLVEYFFRYLGFFIYERRKSDEDYLFQSVGENKNTRRAMFPMVGHGYCPGYEELKTNKWYNQWSKIRDSDKWFNVIQGFIKKDSSYDLTKNVNLRIVYTYRNIYDALLSLYEHMSNHKNFNIADRALDEVALKILPQYIKSYVSFREMKKLYPENILMVHYDEIINHRRQFLLEICGFCKIKESHDNFDEAFEKAYEYTSIMKMKQLEEFMGEPLAKDQKFYNASNSHIRAVDRKSERASMPKELTRRISLKLKEFEIDEFYLDS